MGLIRAFGTLIIMFAVLLGGSAVAHAHAGHTHKAISHAQPVSVSAKAVWSGAALGLSGVERHSQKTAPSVSQVNVDQIRLLAASSDSPHDSGACIPGACCCQGISSCGMAGHCCAGALPQGASAWAQNKRNLRTPLPKLTFHYSDVVFGLDRPPKV